MSPYVPPQASGPYPPPQASGGWGCGGVALLLVGGGVLLVLLCCGGFLYLGWQGLYVEGQQAYGVALDAIRAHPVAREKLGGAIEGGFPSQSNVNFSNDTGTAKFQFVVTGDKGSASVNATLQKVGGEWRPDQIQVRFSDGATHDLAQP